MELKDVFSGVGDAFKLISDSAPATILSVLGFILVILACALGYRAITTDSKDLPRGFMMAFFSALVFGIIFSVAGPSISLISTHIERVPPERSFSNLKDNTRVSYLVRLITYDPNRESYLELAQLQKIGGPEQLWTFVGDYNELRGYTVENAVTMLGGHVSRGQRVSAIIFPVSDPPTLYPANARGLLQTIRKVEENEGVMLDKKFDVNRHLSGLSLPDPDSESLIAWRFDKDTYPQLCEVAQSFRCDGDFTAKKLISALRSDWHPLGFSSKEPLAANACEHREAVCQISDFDKAKKELLPIFGARVFLTRNQELKALVGRYMIDFDDPRYQLVPDIGFPTRVQ